jgi:hypothetical protein
MGSRKSQGNVYSGSPNTKHLHYRSAYHLHAHGLRLTGSFGVVRQAAVLVILFQRPDDDKLSVVLTTRAKTLR